MSENQNAIQYAGLLQMVESYDGIRERVIYAQIAEDGQIRVGIAEDGDGIILVRRHAETNYWISMAACRTSLVQQMCMLDGYPCHRAPVA